MNRNNCFKMFRILSIGINLRMQQEQTGRSVQNLVAIENWGAKCYHSTGFGSWISRDPLDYHFQILQTSCHVHWKIVRLGKNLENHQIFRSWLWNILSTSSQSKFFQNIFWVLKLLWPFGHYKSHCFFTSLNSKGKSSFKLCLLALLDIHRPL